MSFVMKACNKRATDRQPGSFMQVRTGSTIHVMHYADRTLCGVLEQWMGGYRTFNEKTVVFSTHQLPKGEPCKVCFAALAAEARRIYNS